jgi:hypothetical protein
MNAVEHTTSPSGFPHQAVFPHVANMRRWLLSLGQCCYHTFDFTMKDVALEFNVHGSMHRKNILIYIYISNMMQCYTVYFILSGNCSTCSGPYHHPSSGAQAPVSTASRICHIITATCHTTHHQERKQLYLQHLVFVTPLLLPAAIGR